MEREVTLGRADVEKILTDYNLGSLQEIVPLTAGTVQTNLLLHTTSGKAVLRWYKQNRTVEAVRFEVDLINYLRSRNYPCPAVVRNQRGDFLGVYRARPYAIFTFVEGVHIEQPTAAQQRTLIEKVAALQLLTEGYHPADVEHRWNYDVAFCARMATEIATRIGTPHAQAKLAWYRKTLTGLALPAAHPKGICHGDFHFSNVLFKDGRFHALLDFDDANYTYLTFDLVSLIEPYLYRFQWDNWQGVQPRDACYDFTQAREILAIYQEVRPLSALEKRHLFDVLKLATLIDCLWYFARGDVDHFYERRKIECLDGLGRDSFEEALFMMDM